ncbi:MAG: hypothetical protein ACXWXZ_17995, partial [Candidatus Binatia bacterium]
MFNRFAFDAGFCKCPGDCRPSDWEMSRAKARRRQVRRRKINFITNVFHPHSPTFAALAPLREKIRVPVAALGFGDKACGLDAR